MLITRIPADIFGKLFGDKGYISTMLPAQENFKQMHSKPAMVRTITLKIVLLSFLVLLLIGLLGTTVTAFDIRDTGKRLLVLGFSIGAFCLLVTILIVTLRSKAPKYTGILVDDNGLHEYGKNAPTLSLLYESLDINNEDGVYDVLFTDQGYADTNSELCVFIKDESGNTRTQAVVFRVFFTPDGNALKRHFIKGIMRFRPDLRIDPEALKWYRIST